MTRPDYITCVRTGIHQSNQTWCGREVSVEFCFNDSSHAILNSFNNGRSLICKECGIKMIELIQQNLEG